MMQHYVKFCLLLRIKVSNFINSHFLCVSKHSLTFDQLHFSVNTGKDIYMGGTYNDAVAQVTSSGSVVNVAEDDDVDDVESLKINARYQ